MCNALLVISKRCRAEQSNIQGLVESGVVNAPSGDAMGLG